MENQNSKLGVVLCVRDQGGVVKTQNISCQLFCGNRVGEVCHSGCNYFLSGSEKEGIKIYKNVIINDEACDLVFVRLMKEKISIIELHKKKFEEIFTLLCQQGLSKSEERILKMKVAGFRVREIARLLFISEATVKSHLLHAYQKIGSELLNRIRLLQKEKP